MSVPYQETIQEESRGGRKCWITVRLPKIGPIAFYRARETERDHIILVARQFEPKYRWSGACLRLKIRHTSRPPLSYRDPLLPLPLRLPSSTIFFRVFSSSHAL